MQSLYAGIHSFMQLPAAVHSKCRHAEAATSAGGDMRDVLAAQQLQQCYHLQQGHSVCDTEDILHRASPFMYQAEAELAELLNSE